MGVRHSVQTPTLLALIIVLFAATRGFAAGSVYAWPDTYLGRLETFALIEWLNGELLASPSATAVLQRWCALHHMAIPARIVAIVTRGAQRSASAEDRAVLGVGSDETLRYRRVSLACGEHVLSQAENWYVPSRLTSAMNRALDSTDAPFGFVIAPLRPARQTLSVEQLWSPLPAGWEMGAMHFAGASRLEIPPDIFRHRAVVFDQAHRPLALVVETYTSAVLDFPRPQKVCGGSSCP